MIDCILVKQEHLKYIQDSRSYAGMATPTDHRLVRAKVKIDKPSYPFKKKQENLVQYDRQKLKLENINKEYQDLVKQKIDSIKENDTPQEKWNKIVNACQTTAAEIAPKEK